MKMVDESQNRTILGSKKSRPHSREATWEIPGHVPASPYRIRIVRTAAHLHLAVDVRYRAYTEKLQALASKVKQPGWLDFAHEPIVLLAENALTNQPVGTLRINTGPEFLETLSDISLPEKIVNGRVAFVSRMAVIGDVHERQLVRLLMQKAVFQLCIAKQLRTILLLAVEPRERLFYRCGFTDVFEDRLARFPAFLDGFPVKVLYADTYSMERVWREQKHPLYDFLFRTFHPEIEVFSSLSSIQQRSEEARVLPRNEHPADSLWVS